ncbi:MAG: hypothetical protein IH899_16805 [Planctomycetes bacterium]|nr:hypothetical protein [Planctomycetota bacterium]
MRNTSTVPIVARRKTMMGTLSVLVDELDSDEFIVGDLEASDSEFPVAVTDRETAAVEFRTAGTHPDKLPNNHEPGIESFLYKGDPVNDQHDSTHPLYVRTRSHAPQLQKFPPLDAAE